MNVGKNAEDRPPNPVLGEAAMASLSGYEATREVLTIPTQTRQPAPARYEPQRELTVAEAAADPLIRILNEADCICERSFAQLLESAARVLTCSPSVIPDETSNDGLLTYLQIFAGISKELEVE